MSHAAQGRESESAAQQGKVLFTFPPSEVNSVSEDDESGHTVTLEELVDEPYWVTKGKVAGRMAEMFDSFRPILEQGMLRKPGVDENTIHTSLANERFHSFQVICLVVPKLAEVFDEADVAGMLGPKLVSKLHSLGFLAIHISPGAAKGDIRTTRGGNASLHDISFVTLESVVYIAVLVHFGLSSQPNFSASNETDGQFLYSDFYCKILDMANKMTHTEKGDLIDWWNEKIFPDARRTRRSTATTCKTILEEMEDELEVARQARAGSRGGLQEDSSDVRQGSIVRTQASVHSSEEGEAEGRTAAVQSVTAVAEAE
ncbi:hypothetical protein C8Q72DRAFT_887611 [Fomitopsis betulina]|nr:hypothetical protein C8Q72DRAFT_887611 [Fomitopsis betulina]